MIFKCKACGEPLSHLAAICRNCKDSLIFSPPLCESCFTINKKNHPCIVGRKVISSIFVNYLMTTHTYPVFRNWKSQSGLIFNQQVLIQHNALQAWLSSKKPFRICPIPQDPMRSFQLGRSPSYQLAKWIHKICEQPIVEALEIDKELQKQSKKNREERIESRTRFFLKRPVYDRVLLVDDFVTSGSTFQDAAITLISCGCSDVIAFALGYKPFFQSETLASTSETAPAFDSQKKARST